jgi:undecaprenyl-diphosphatase
MSLIHILILAVIQGAAELLPVSSSAHVIVAEKMMGLDPSAPEMTFFLVMLHTGTMFAVLVYFWNRWKRLIRNQKGFLGAVALATAVTGILGFGLKILIEKIILEKLMGQTKGEVEQLFQHLPLIAANLLLIGILILYSSRAVVEKIQISSRDSIAIGLIQAICLPLRGFSRSGATISAGLLRKLPRPVVEDFSFALAVVLTPPVIFIEARRLLKATETHSAITMNELSGLLQPGLIGMVLSFVAGLLALKWLSRWLEDGKWRYFGYYCVLASAMVMAGSFFF